MLNERGRGDLRQLVRRAVHNAAALFVRIDVQLASNSPDHTELFGRDEFAKAACDRIGREVVVAIGLRRLTLALDSIELLFIELSRDPEFYGRPLQGVVF